MKLTGKQLTKGICILIAISYLVWIVTFILFSDDSEILFKIMAALPGIILLIYSFFIELVDNDDLKKLENGEVKKNPAKLYIRMESQHQPLRNKFK